MFSPGGGGAFLPDEEDAMLIAQQRKTVDQQQQEIRALKIRIAELEVGWVSQGGEIILFTHLPCSKSHFRHRANRTKGKLGNTHICSRYVPEWGLKEGIRELIQNFFDACLRRCVEVLTLILPLVYKQI